MKKDYMIIAYLSMRGLFLGVGLSNILVLSKTYLIISLIIGIFLGYSIVKLINKKTDSIYFNLIENATLFVIAFLLLINMISSMYLTKMPKILIGLPIISTILYLLSKKEKVIFRVSNIIFVINILLYIFASFTLLKYVNISNFYYTKISVLNILNAAFKYAIYSSFPFIICKSMINKKVNLNKIYLISSLTMCVIVITTYLILGPNLSEMFKYPEYIILKKVSIGTFINNIENIISFMWIIDEAILLFISSNNIKKEFNKKTLCIILSILFVITIYISNKYIILMYLYKYIDIILFILLLIHLIYLKLHQKS